MRTLSADMSVYSDIELEFFVKELTEALDCIERLSEPEEEYETFDIDITRSPIFFGYTEASRKSIDRILNTLYTEQELRSTLKEEMMKKLDAYSLSQLTSIYYTVITDIEQHKDLLEMLSSEDGTSFRKDTENYIEKQERYLKLITDVIKKRNAETPTTDPESGDNTPTNNDTPSNDNPTNNDSETPNTNSNNNEEQNTENNNTEQNDESTNTETNNETTPDQTNNTPIDNNTGNETTDPDNSQNNTDTGDSPLENSGLGMGLGMGNPNNG